MGEANKLQKYRSKRNFSITPEPEESGLASESLRFVIQKHWASRLHYDFRLELNGVMKSWAVPKGPSFDPADKRLAVHVEDHPISYADFEGIIPEKQYGAGKVIIWDKGYWHPLGKPDTDYKKGNLKFELSGIKLQGKWALVRIKGDHEKQEPWLLVKEKDELAKPSAEFSVVDEYPDSVSKNPFPENNIAHKQDKKKPKKTEDILKQAAKADLPELVKPQLATLVERLPPIVEDWIYEIKFDGYRLLTKIDNGKVTFFTRNGNDWTHKLKNLQQAVEKLKWPSGWYDGEIVVTNEQGVPDFGALQLAFENGKSHNIVLYLFDVMYFKGFDLRAIPQTNRRDILKKLLEKNTSELIRLSEAFEASSESLLKSACQLGLEGIIAKRADSPYSSARTLNWLKLKCKQGQEFVILGYTSPKGQRSGFGALLLGVYDKDSKLVHVGNVGTGFNQNSLTSLKQKFDAIKIKKSPVKDFKAPTDTTWIKPMLIAEVEFGEWTASGHIRHPVFKGIRTDKAPQTIIREQPKNYLNKSKGSTQQPPEKSLKITNPDRKVDPAEGITKIDVVRYYQLIGELMMPHLEKRPVSFLRAPDGITSELFFQKHAATEKLPGVKETDSADGEQPLIEIVSKEGLASAAQWNVIEFHTYNGITSLKAPDRLVFDLDPGENVKWSQVQEAAQLMQAFLSQLKLPAYLKTSGGKGLHIVIPVTKNHDWDTVKSFAQAVVVHMSKTIPSRFVAKSGPKNRVGKIFIDYLRNDQHATTVCAWSLRARPGLGISVPVDWSELMELKGANHWTIRNAHTRLDKGNEVWKTYSKSAVDLTDAISALKPDG